MLEHHPEAGRCVCSKHLKIVYWNYQSANLASEVMRSISSARMGFDVVAAPAVRYGGYSEMFHLLPDRRWKESNADTPRAPGGLHEMMVTNWIKGSP
jgi:hypothetical protein